MRNIKAYYDNRVRSSDQGDYLYQVGHTVHGQPISQAKFFKLCAQIETELQLTDTDVLLDICCGNGVFTSQLGRTAKTVVGIDNSTALLDVAQQVHCPENTDYHLVDATALSGLKRTVKQPFTKVVMYAALQHFSPAQFKKMLGELAELTTKDAIIFIGFIPNRSRKWRFYKTVSFKLEYLIRQLIGKDNFGTWWSDDQIRDICRSRGLECRFSKLPPSLHAASYRFNVTVFKQDTHVRNTTN